MNEETTKTIRHGVLPEGVLDIETLNIPFVLKTVMINGGSVPVMTWNGKYCMTLTKLTNQTENK